MIRVFIGYDQNETVAYHVLAHSIMHHASEPVAITPLKLSQLPMTRERAEFQSTEFSFSRFLVPYLCGFDGRALFMDCDMLCRSDIAELWYSIGDEPVSVVKHEYAPRPEDKFLGQKQSIYQKKNWSSMMVFNNRLCTELTPHTVNTQTGLYLHQFKWLADDSLIGEIGREWNHLVGEYAPNPAARLVHYTLGTPCFRKYEYCEFAQEWRDEKASMLDYNKYGEFSLVERTGT